MSWIAFHAKLFPILFKENILVPYQVLTDSMVLARLGGHRLIRDFTSKIECRRHPL
jgi:hypothetical protein